ncbi:hypothetical protein N9S81_00575, partial [bacterium]|nr:hypothetical protein [bacterium]
MFGEEEFPPEDFSQCSSGSERKQKDHITLEAWQKTETGAEMSLKMQCPSEPPEVVQTSFNAFQKMAEEQAKRQKTYGVIAGVMQWFAVVYIRRLVNIDPNHPLYGVVYIGQAVRYASNEIEAARLRWNRENNNAETEWHDIGLLAALRMFGKDAFEDGVLHWICGPTETKEMHTFACSKETKEITNHGGILKDMRRRCRQTLNILHGSTTDTIEYRQSYAAHLFELFYSYMKDYSDQYLTSLVPQKFVTSDGYPLGKRLNMLRVGRWINGHPFESEYRRRCEQLPRWHWNAREVNFEETQRVAGYRDVHPAGIPIDQDAYVLEAREALADTKALVATLGNNNPILRSFLGTAVSDLEGEIVRTRDAAAARPTITASGKYEPSSAGRRLLERDVEFPKDVLSAMVDHPIQKAYRAGVPGVSRAACEALCEALAVTVNNTDPERCEAFGFVRQNPFSLTDTVGRCYLLTSAGGCQAEDFGAALFSRNIMSERQCHAAAPGYDNPLCIQLSTTRVDTRVLSHSDAVSIAAQTPRDSAPGSGGLPAPRNALEAGSFIAFARREGVYAFWASRPPNLYQDVTTHWVAPGGAELVVKRGDTRCILVSSTTSSTAQAMYARLEPCSAKLADGMVTVAVSTTHTL